MGKGTRRYSHKEKQTNPNSESEYLSDNMLPQLTRTQKRQEQSQRKILGELIENRGKKPNYTKKDN